MVPRTYVATCLLMALLLNIYSFAEEPWGLDSDILQADVARMQSCKPGLMVSFGEVMIHFHQNVISPADGPRSNFTPTSSQYTLDAIRKYGFFQGVIMGCDRLMREGTDPWVYPVMCVDGRLIKWDAVP